MIKDLMSNINLNATDKQLIDAVKKKNDKAFTVIYNRYSEIVTKHLKIKTSNNSLINTTIEDVVIETFVTLWENIINGNYENQGYLKAYLQQIAYYKLLRKLDKNKKIKSIESIKELSDEDNEEELLNLLDDDIIDYNKIAENALNNLKEKCLQVIILKFYNKLSDNEIYNRFPDNYTSAGSIRKKRLRCMEKLRNESHTILDKLN